MRIPALAPLNEQVECRCLINRILYPQRHISFSAYQVDVAAECRQRLEPWFEHAHAHGQHLKRQEKVLRTRILGTPSYLMLHDDAPQVYLAVDAVPRVSGGVQVFKAFRGVHAAGALLLRGVMRRLCATDDDSVRRSPASRRQWLARRPSLAVQRPEPSGIPLPDA